MPAPQSAQHPATVRLMARIRVKVEQADRQADTRLKSIRERHTRRRAKLLTLPENVITWIQFTTDEPKHRARLIDGLKLMRYPNHKPIKDAR